jgi:hypothetical protein
MVSGRPVGASMVEALAFSLAPRPRCQEQSDVPSQLFLPDLVPFDLDDTDERRATPLSSLKLGPPS